MTKNRPDQGEGNAEHYHKGQRVAVKLERENEGGADQPGEQRRQDRGLGFLLLFCAPPMPILVEGNCSCSLEPSSSAIDLAQNAHDGEAVFTGDLGVGSGQLDLGDGAKRDLFAARNCQRELFKIAQCGHGIIKLGPNAHIRKLLAKAVGESCLSRCRKTRREAGRGSLAA